MPPTSEPSLVLAPRKKARTSSSRAFHAKVKTGCLSCKESHVKCDETRPICLRCKRLNRVCKGYPSDEPKPKPAAQEKKKSVPFKPLQPLPRNTQNHISILVKPSDELFLTENEYQYFRNFSDKVAYYFSPYFSPYDEPESWSRMILQACARERSVREAAAAIGALGMKFELVSKLQSSKNPGSLGAETVKDSDIQLHQQYAIEQYDKAVRRMRLNVANGTVDVRTALITCIITTCFEILIGNYDAYVGQTRSAIQILHNWKARQKNNAKHPTGFSSPAPSVIDDFLVQTIGKIENHSMTFVFDPRPLEEHLLLRDEGLEQIQRMPRCFTSLRQAQLYLEFIIARIQHSMACLGSSPSIYGVRYETTTGPARKHFVTANPSSKRETTTALDKDLTAWGNSFNAFTQKAGLFSPNPRSSTEKKIALTLLCIATTAHVNVQGVVFDQETGYDIFLPEFSSIVTWAEEILELEDQTPPPKGSSSPTYHSFDQEILAPLSVVGRKCRNWGIRKKALALLDRYPSKEGFWDSLIAAELLRWVIRLEEGAVMASEGAEDAFIPESMRVRNTEVQLDLVGRKAKMICLQYDVEVGDWVSRHHVFGLDYIVGSRDAGFPLCQVTIRSPI